jgi:hypothetical protein
MKIGYVFHDLAPLFFVFGGSTQFDSRLLLDALESASRNIPVRMRHRNPSAFRRMFELLMTSGLIHLMPTSLQQPLYDLPAVHHSASRDMEIIHIKYTLIKREKMEGVIPTWREFRA